jgi:polyisoprenyl-teichoic acid--peptidoglycan teichoic acid transferase
MSDKKSPYRGANGVKPSRAFDIAPPKGQKNNNTNFPGVGMTLGSYQANGAGSRRNRRHVEQPKSRWARFKSKITLKRTIILLALLVLLVVGFVGFKLVYNAHRLFGGSVFDALTSGKLDGESTGRVNILLAGNSADDPGHQGATLTDSIMVISIDTKNNTAFMLSIPRDLYVKIPGNGYQKINAAYPAGERDKFKEDGYAEGGMGQLQQIIEENIGIKTHYYALVNYNALRDAVNAVGGVTVTVNSTDKRGLYDSSKDWSTGKPLVKLTNGKHTLNGQAALNLARARGEGRGSYGYANSDFTRTEHQRQLILALRSKATSAGVLTNPVKLGGLFDSLGSNVDTDLSLGNVRRLYEVTKGIGGTNIKSVGLNDADGQNLLTSYRTSGGASALVPAAGLNDYSDIQRYIRRLTSNNLVVREGASVVLLNGTSTSGVAARESDLLEKKQIQVSEIGDADTETQTVTQIIDLSGGKMPGTLKALQGAYSGSTVTTSNPYGTRYDVDFIIVLGSDRVSTESTSTSN